MNARGTRRPRGGGGRGPKVRGGGGGRGGRGGGGSKSSGCLVLVAAFTGALLAIAAGASLIGAALGHPPA